VQSKTDLLIIGAGPFGLSIAARASQLGLNHLIVGKPMEFWRSNMPNGMFLRSACDWHLDPENVETIESYLAEMGQTPAGVEPLSLAFYHSYVEWFQMRKGIAPHQDYVERLDYQSSTGYFVATTTAKDNIEAKRVVIAPGFKYFPNIPDELRSKLANGRYAHTCDYVDFSDAKGKRFLILGGRQSAFEWAALLLEAGASEVHLSHRHDSPSFETSDWSWVNRTVEAIAENPGWFRNLSQSEKDDVNSRLWAEGRLKIEPWLESRLATPRVKLWPRTQLMNCVEQGNGELAIELSDGTTLNVDKVILATGYKVNISNVPYLSAGNLIGPLETRNGFPVLKENFETSIPGLFITSMPATQDFGPFFGFTIAARVSAQLIGKALSQSI
jgi:cation diffusion facilitator CzcD-associated flavoprotein CzcO